jgi:energy-converting hydrogenase Eha subunit E
MVNEPATPPRLRGWLLMTIGLLAIVVGTLWTVQGLGILTDSKMSGKQTWTFIGAAVAVLGLILTVIGERVRSRSKRKGQ